MVSLEPKKQMLLLWLLFLIVIGNFIINYLWRQQLYNLGLDIISQWQHSQNLLLTIILTIPTLLIDPGFIILVFFIQLIRIKQKSNIISTVLWILLNAFGSCLLKAFYADPRPFWSRSEILSLGLNCPQQYGNPSGHSWFSVIVGFGILLVQKQRYQKQQSLILISLALVILVPMSRMYLGAHSLNQVIQGVFFGFIMVILYEFCGLKEAMYSYLKNFHSAPGHKWKKVTLIFHVFYMIGFVINLNQYNPYLQPVPQNWAKNMINQCNKSTPPHHLNFTMLMLNSLIVNFSTGLAWGYEQMNITAKGRIYLSGNWLINQQRYPFYMACFWLIVIEAGLLIIGFLPFAIVVYFFGQGYWILFVFGNIGAFLSGFLYTSKAFKILFENQIIRQQVN